MIRNRQNNHSLEQASQQQQQHNPGKPEGVGY